MYLAYLMCESLNWSMDHLTNYKNHTCDSVTYANNKPFMVPHQEYCHSVHSNSRNAVSEETICYTEYPGCSLTNSALISSSSCHSLSLRKSLVSPGQINEFPDIIQNNDSNMKIRKKQTTKPKTGERRTKPTVRNALTVVKSGYFTTQIETVDKNVLKRREPRKNQLIRKSSADLQQKNQIESDATLAEATSDSLTMVNVSSVTNTQKKNKHGDSNVSIDEDTGTLQSDALIKQTSDNLMVLGPTVLNEGENADNPVTGNTNRSSTRSKPVGSESVPTSPGKDILRANSESPEILGSFEISKTKLKKSSKIRKSFSKFRKKFKTKLIPT